MPPAPVRESVDKPARRGKQDLPISTRSAFFADTGEWTMTTRGFVRPDAAEASRLSALSAAALCAALGLFLLYGVGFAHPEALHNAAHDSRHAFAFPCH
jgi:cobalt transporter subunit CbtB